MKSQIKERCHLPPAVFRRAIARAHADEGRAKLRAVRAFHQDRGPGIDRQLAGLQSQRETNLFIGEGHEQGLPPQRTRIA